MRYLTRKDASFADIVSDEIANRRQQRKGANKVSAKKRGQQPPPGAKEGLTPATITRTTAAAATHAFMLPGKNFSSRAPWNVIECGYSDSDSGSPLVPCGRLQNAAWTTESQEEYLLRPSNETMSPRCLPASDRENLAGCCTRTPYFCAGPRWSQEAEGIQSSGFCCQIPQIFQGDPNTTRPAYMDAQYAKLAPHRKTVVLPARGSSPPARARHPDEVDTTTTTITRGRQTIGRSLLSALESGSRSSQHFLLKKNAAQSNPPNSAQSARRRRPGLVTRSSSSSSATNRLRQQQHPDFVFSMMEQKLQALVKDNLSLYNENRQLRNETESVKAQGKETKEALLKALAEKHERRIKLVKEEFDFRLAEQKERQDQELKDLAKKEQQLLQRIRELEQRCVQLDVSVKDAVEAQKNEARRADEEVKQRQGLEEQVAAALSTVTQFSERHAQLLREVETLHAHLESCGRQLERKTDDVATLQMEISNGKERAEALVQEASALRMEISTCKSKQAATDVQLHDQNKVIVNLTEALQKCEEQKTSLSNTVDKLQVDILSKEENLSELSVERNCAAQREAETIDVLKTAWDEIAALKQECSLLRQQIRQKDVSILKLQRYITRPPTSNNKSAILLAPPPSWCQQHNDGERFAATTYAETKNGNKKFQHHLAIQSNSSKETNGVLLIRKKSPPPLCVRPASSPAALNGSLAPSLAPPKPNTAAELERQKTGIPINELPRSTTTAVAKTAGALRESDCTPQDDDDRRLVQEQAGQKENDDDDDGDGATTTTAEQTGIGKEIEIPRHALRWLELGSTRCSSPTENLDLFSQQQQQQGRLQQQQSPPAERGHVLCSSVPLVPSSQADRIPLSNISAARKEEHLDFPPPVQFPYQHVVLPTRTRLDSSTSGASCSSGIGSLSSEEEEEEGPRLRRGQQATTATTTRLVKVTSPAGQCRYELRTTSDSLRRAPEIG